MFGKIQIVIQPTKAGYAAKEFHNSLSNIDYDNKIMHIQRQCLSAVNT